MTSEEIKESARNFDWLREIAYQLAVMNERAASQPTFVFSLHAPVGPGLDLQKGQNT